MAYEKLSDVTTVVLGGVDKKTGKRNPTELEGYYLRSEQRPNKFNPGKPQNYYVYQTQNGEEGIYAKAGLDREMKKATIGAMTKVVHTGKTLDTGKGNPMVLFDVFQDKTNTIEVAQSVVLEQSLDESESYQESDIDDESDTYSLPSTPPATVTPKYAAARPADPARAAKVQALLGKR